MATVKDTSVPVDTRREMRRRKILESSEERMKKIAGYNTQGHDDQVGKDPAGASHTHNPDNPGQVTWEGVFEADHVAADGGWREADCGPPATEPVPSANATRPTEASEPVRKPVTASPATVQEQVLKEYVSFNRFRTVVFLMVGFLIRLSLSYKLGQHYVQNILNPFIAVEIALIGYQRAVDMDLGIGVKGGLWLSTLHLSGIRPEIIHTYRAVMGAVTAAAGDFAIFFLAFIFAHLAL